MFIVQALADFSKQTLAAVAEDKVEDQQGEGEQVGEDEEASVKRERAPDQEQELQKLANEQEQPTHNKTETKNNKKEDPAADDKQQATQQGSQTKFITFSAGQKILVKQTFQNGWWYGHPIGKPQFEGFFPSNYVKVGVQPPPPQEKTTKKGKQEKGDEQMPEFDPAEGTDWMKKELEKVPMGGPVTSDYYQGIKNYKTVKIDEKNQNILKGNYVQYDVATGLARVPVKDQAPTAKAVRQMGYYFDYHQWNQHRNVAPPPKSRPDPRKKKAKKLNLKMMDRM